MKAAEAIVLLAVAAGLGVALILAGSHRAAGWWRARQLRRAPWQLTEHSDGEQVCVYAERPGEDQLLIGAAPFAARDFEDQLYQLRADGRERVYALNQKDST